MYVGMVFLQNLFENCHAQLSLFLNDSLFGNLQEYNQFHIYDNIPRSKWKPNIAYILLIFTCFCYFLFEILEMTFENSFLLIISVLMRFKEEKYGKFHQRASEIQLPKKDQISLLPCFQVNIYKFMNNFIIRFTFEDHVTPS